MATLTRSAAFSVLAAFSACAAAYHIAGVAGALPYDNSPLWRHLTFVAIDACGVWYLLTRPLALLPVFAALVVQQFASHGSRAIRWWTQDGRVDAISVLTLSALSVATVLLLLDGRNRSPLIRRIVCPFAGSTPGVTKS